MQWTSYLRRSKHTSIINKKSSYFPFHMLVNLIYSSSAKVVTIKHAFGYSLTEASRSLTMGSELLLIFPMSLPTLIYFPAFFV